jgi:hypothetical protein
MARCRCDRVRRRSRCVHHLWPPWKSPHAKRCPVIYSCFIPCVALYELRITTLQTLPLGRPDRCRRLAARQPSDASPMDRRPHLADETFGGEECAAENCEREKNTCRRRARNIFSSRRGLARAIKLQPPRQPRGKRLNSRTFGRSDSCRMIGGRCSKKIPPKSRRTQDFRVASVTMTLTHCHMCGFLARFFYVAFDLAPWLKGF